MGLAGPVGFEPGMFKKEGETKHKSDPTKVRIFFSEINKKFKKI